jgi:hypothetical protein
MKRGHYLLLCKCLTPDTKGEPMNCIFRKKVQYLLGFNFRNSKLQNGELMRYILRTRTIRAPPDWFDCIARSLNMTSRITPRTSST